MHFRCHHLLHQHVLAQGADLRQSCTEAVRMLDNGCRACVPDSGRGLTCVRTQPLAASSMLQEGVPLRLSLGPLDACSREVDLLVVLSSKACHSCSSSCVSGFSTLSRLSTAAGTAVFLQSRELPQRAVDWAALSRCVPQCLGGRVLQCNA